MKWITGLFLLFISCNDLIAATRFWNPYSVTGAISGTAGVCRLTITPAITGSGLVAGTSVTVAGITGVTGCNVTATISTVVDTTHIELTGTTFGGAGFGGTACAGGGNWTATNTSNWAATSTATCGSGGSSVPTSSDSVTLDANSGGGTVVPNFGGLITITSLDLGAFGGTFDNTVNNNSFTATASAGISFSGTGTRTINMGSGTWSVSSSTGGNKFNVGTTTNLTLNANTSTVALTGAGGQAFDLANKTFNIVSISGRAAGPAVSDASTGTHTIASLVISPPNVYTISTSGATTISALTAVGTSSNQIMIRSSSLGNSSTFSTAGALTCTYCSFRDLTRSGAGSITASSSLDLGNNSGITFGGSGGCILGGWLLWRDMPEHLNDNFPAWLEKAG